VFSYRGDVVNVILAILIGSLSLVLLGPEMQGMSLIIYYKRLNIICLVLELSHMLREGRERSENGGDDSGESEHDIEKDNGLCVP
jgi:hypothetical protein